ncbi:hypothetical protein [Massilia timonae]|uniref:hypothetical protein n=1 Tax=Massilia timonae TaxID=47229 RepID=UPI0023568982|nr:hypothetical protein [Massilia timonae]
MRRYYLADLIGDGTPDTNEWRPSVANYRVGWGWSCPMGVNGVPLNNWGLVEVFNESPEAIAAMEKDLSIDPLPHVPHDTPLASIDTTRVIVALTRRNIGRDVLDRARTFGELLANIAARAAALE